MLSKNANKSRVLLIAYHFPPLMGSSGLLRTLKFASYLPEHGYEPFVLTVHPRVYENKNESLVSTIPGTVKVIRACAFDTKVNLSFRGAYFDLMAFPDRLGTWIPFAVLKGLYLIRKHQIQLIYSTYPIVSAHYIGYYLNRLTKCPWIADFRDPMFDPYIQLKPLHLLVRERLEAKIVKYSAHILTTTEGIRKTLLNRYLELKGNHISVIPNGFDEADFISAELDTHKQDMPYKIIHAGLLDPNDRDPIPFFHSIKRLLDKKKITKNDITVDLFAPGNDNKYEVEIEKLGLRSIVKIKPSIRYRQILKEMVGADILLLFQGESCNHQIPAKAYEYLRSGRPILALTPPGSETARLISTTRSGAIVDPKDSGTIAKQLAIWIDCLKRGKTLPAASPEIAKQYSRQKQTDMLARIFDCLTAKF